MRETAPSYSARVKFDWGTGDGGGGRRDGAVTLGSRRAEPVTDPIDPFARAPIPPPASPVPNSRGDDPGPALKVIPRHHPVVIGERHVRDLRRQAVRRRSRDALQLRTPV